MSRQLSLLLAVVAFFLLTGQACVRFSRPQPAGPTVMRSDNRGIDWVGKDFAGTIQAEDETRTLTLTGASTHDLRFSPPNPDRIFLSTEHDGLFTSTNRGEEWERTGYTGRVVDFALDPLDERRLYLTNGKQIFTSTDGGRNWSTIFTVTRGDEQVQTVNVDFFNPRRLLAASNTGVVYRSTDRGGTWTRVAVLDDSLSRLQFYPADSRIIFLRGAREGLWRSRDGGENWTSLKDALLVFPKGNESLRYTFAGAERTVIYAATAHGILSSTDAGDAWERVPTLFAPPYRVPELVVDPTDEAIITFFTGNKLHQTLDGGSSWTVYTVPNARPLTFLRVDPNDPTVMYLGARVPTE